MSRLRFGLFKCTLCYIWREPKDKRSEENKMQTRRVLMVTSGCTITDVKHVGVGGFLQYNSSTTPTASLSVNKHTQVGQLNLPNDNLLLLFSTTRPRRQERERLVSAVGDRKLFFFFFFSCERYHPIGGLCEESAECFTPQCTRRGEC